MRFTATLDGNNLPDGFRYNPYVPRKRKSVTATANAVITQYANPEIIHGDSIVAWRLQAAFANEYQLLYTLYRAGGDIVFQGYWGETLLVAFDVLDQPTVQGRLFDMSGQFQVKAETIQQSVTCGGVLVTP